MTAPFESRRCVCFDCDSTLSSIEGIDELAVKAGRTGEIVPLTAAAMDGQLKIEEVYGLRLEILRPSRADLAWLGERYVATIVQGAHDAIQRLQRAGRHVFIVSGGLKPSVLHLADALGVPQSHVDAVDVLFDAQGIYAGYDEASSLTRSDGKAAVCARLAGRYGPAVLVGDGVTDVAARAGGALVIGFGGVVRREAVVRGADAFVDGPSLSGVADYLLA